jgi:hypothetical protein
MSEIPFDEPRRKPSSKVHHLAHLVNAITTQLSACLSLNSLLNHSIPYVNTSEHIAARAEGYHTSLNLSRKSLETFAYYITEQLSISPGADSGFEPGVEGHSLKQGGYDSLKVAARECTKTPDLLQSIQDHQLGLDDMHEGNQWQGWPKCTALDDLKDLNEILLALRDSGGNSDVGWGVAWKLLVDESI